MLPITLCLEIYLRCIKITLIVVMEGSAQYHTTWLLLRPHADEVMLYTDWPQCITTHLQRRSPTDSLPPPSLPFFHTHNQIHIQTLLAGRVRRCEKRNKSAPLLQSKEYSILQHKSIKTFSYGYKCKQLFS